MWLKPLMIPIAVWLDDVMGQGKRIKGQKWWLDIENVDGKIVKARGVNERDLDVKRKRPKTNKVALYLPEDYPPGDHKEPFPNDRKAALKRGDEAMKPENSPSNAP